MSNPDQPDLQKLLRLKRYEQPPPGFYDKFIEEFKERQRGEMLKSSARGLLVERVATWAWGWGPRGWFLAGGATTVLLAAGIYYASDSPSSPAEPDGTPTHEAPPSNQKGDASSPVGPPTPGELNG